MASEAPHRSIASSEPRPSSMSSEAAPVAPSPRRQRYLPAEPDEAAALMYKSFTDADMKPLARELSSHKTLKTLDLRMNLITDTGVDFLASGIEDAHACALVTLNLNGNAITDAGAHRLAAMLRKNTTIQHLGLSANKITDAGASALFHALASHHAFARVSLQGNDIFSEDILDRADALLHSPAPLLRGMYEMGHRSHFNKAGREDSMRRKDSRRATAGAPRYDGFGPCACVSARDGRRWHESCRWWWWWHASAAWYISTARHYEPDGNGRTQPRTYLCPTNTTHTKETFAQAERERITAKLMTAGLDGKIHNVNNDKGLASTYANRLTSEGLIEERRLALAEVYDPHEGMLRAGGMQPKPLPRILNY